jgi:hypothetical protein
MHDLLGLLDLGHLFIAGVQVKSDGNSEGREGKVILE